MHNKNTKEKYYPTAVALQWSVWSYGHMRRQWMYIDENVSVCPFVKNQVDSFINDPINYNYYVRAGSTFRYTPTKRGGGK